MVTTVLDNQFGAALGSLKYCIENCPDDGWQQAQGDYPFSQVVFHTLFYADFYLSESLEAFKAQDFHLRNETLFTDYEELSDRLPVNLYSKAQCLSYLHHCAERCFLVFSGNDDDDLSGRPLTRPELGTGLELHLYSIRHIQHHTAQLALRLQFLTGKEMPWFFSGWKGLRS